MKNRVLSLVLILALLCTLMPAAVPTAHAETYSGTCGAEGDGSNLTWELDTETGTLNIHGTGAMKNYTTNYLWESYISAPWHCYSSSIKTVTIGYGVTSIGDSAFYGCSLQCVTIPDSVTSIGSYAFAHCSLTSVTIPDSVISIGEKAFGYYYYYSWYYDEWYCEWNLSEGHDRIPDFFIYGYYNSTAYDYAKNNSFPFFLLADAEGTCGAEGDNLTWKLDSETGALSFQGNGAMKNWTASSSVPWFLFRNCVKTVSIGESVTSIGSYAFSGCEALTSVTIPDSVTSIGDHTFYNCTGLTEITIPNGVMSIGDYAFSGCSSLTSVTIGNSVTSIGDSAFSGCSSLTNVTIPDSVTSIGSSAFYNCRSLTSVMIGSGVSSIGGSVFARNGSLVEFRVSSDNPYVRSLDGVLFNKDKTELIAYPIGKPDVGYEIPDSVTSIGSSAFSYCTSLISVTIPDSVTSIGGSAFYNCSSLTSVMIGSSVTSIGSSAFSYCTSLLSVKIPDSVTSIGGSAFYNCSSLTSVMVGNSVTSIDSSMFYGCTALTIVVIPDSVTSIGEMAFGYYLISAGNNVSEPVYGKNSSLTFYVSPGSAAENYALANGFNCDHAYVVDCGAEDKNLTWSFDEDTGTLTIVGIGKMAQFYDGAPWMPLYREKIKQVILSEGVSNIGAGAFYHCTSLTSVTIPDSVTSIGEGAFTGCTSLTSVTIPDSVTSIGEWAFADCSGLTSVTIGKGVTRIGDYAFSGCTSLTSVTIPDSVTSIDYGAFFIHSDLTIYGYFGTAAYDYAKEFQLRFVPLSPVVSGFCGGEGDGTNLTWTLNTETGILTISGTGLMADWDFWESDYYFTPWFEYRGYVKTVIITNGVTNIGNEAFAGCTSLTSVTIPDSVTSIGYGAFAGCTSLTSVTIPDSVTYIGYYAFSGCSSLMSVTIPDSVTSIGEGAFSGCSGLIDITLPFVGDQPHNASDPYQYPFGYIFGTSSYTGGTETEQFYYGSSTASTTSSTYYIPNTLRSVTITGSSQIPYSAFFNCFGLTNVTIPDSVTSIGNSAFSGCRGLTNITIPDSVTSIGGSAFDKCRSLTSVTIPDSVTSIGEYAFYCCSSLMSVTIGNGVTSIEWNAFSGCSSLTSVTIPDSVTSIFEYAFGYYNDYQRVDGFTVYGHYGTAGYDYALNNGFTFVLLCADGTTNHNYQPTVTAPTCTAGGFTAYTCTLCGDVYTDDHTEATGHAYQLSVWTWSGYTKATANFTCQNDASHTQTAAATITSAHTAPTCEADGKIVYTATATFEGKTYTDAKTQVLNATGHTQGTPVQENRVQPTCTEVGGYDTVVYCTVCRKELSRIHTEILALEHNYRTSVTEPTCTTGGYTTYTCSRCGDTYVADETAPINHDYVAVVTAPTCTTGGYTTYTCANCGNTYTADETAPINHNYAAVVTAPTCTAGGYTTYTCANCGDTYVADEVPAFGHDWGEPAYTWNENNSRVTAERVCMHDAQHKETETVNTTSEVTKPATCMEPGETIYKAAFSNPAFTEQSKAVAIPDAFGHDYHEGICLHCGEADPFYEGAALTVSGISLYAYPGQHLVVPISIEGGVNIAGFTLSVQTDEDLTLIGAERGKLLSGAGGSFTKNLEQSIVNWTSAEEIEASGELLLLTFAVNENVEGIRRHTVALRPKDNKPTNMANQSGNAVSTRFEDCLIVTTPAMFGDTNSDLDVDSADAVRLVRSLVELETLTVNQRIAADVSHDDDVTSADAILLTRFLAGFIDRLDLVPQTSLRGMRDAVTGGSILLGSAEGKSNDTVSIPVTLEGNPGFAGFTLEISAPDALELVGVEKGELLMASDSGAFLVNVEKGIVNWNDVQNLTGDGELFVMKFRIREEAENGSYPVAVALKEGKAGNFVNENGVPISWTIDSGAVAVINHVHNYTDVVTPPTCTEQGYTTHTCACGDSYVDAYVDALGHDLIHHDAQAPNCTEIGWEAYDTCSRCDYTTYAELAATGHTAGDPVEKNRVEPTCTEIGGYDTVVYCTVCNAELSREHTELAALGHDWNEPEYVWADDNSTVTAKRVCKNDESHVVTETVDTTSEITKPASYTEEGEITYTAVFENPAFETQTKAVATPKLELPPVEFSDVTAGAYYANPVAWAVANGITNGTGNGKFSPDATCTRGQVVTFLWRAKGCPEPTSTENPFNDVKVTDYFYKAVLWAKETGVTSGTSATTFSPGNGCTRAQVVTFLWRAEGKPAPESTNNPFTDVPAGQYYYDAVLWAVGKGVTTGTGATTFSPDKTCTRGQIVTFLYRDLA